MKGRRSRPAAGGGEAAAAQFGERMRKRRRELGLSQEDVARFIGVKRSSYAHQEKGRRRFPSTRLSALAQILKTGVEDLLGRQSRSTGALEIARIYDELPADADRERLRQFAEALVRSRRY